MSILKETLHPKNDNNTDIYPKTSTDQIGDLNPSFEIDIDAIALEDEGRMDLTLDTSLGGINRVSRASMRVANEVRFRVTDLDQLNWGILMFDVGIKMGNQWVNSEEQSIVLYKVIVPQSDIRTVEDGGVTYIDGDDQDSYERIGSKLPIMYNGKVYYIASVSENAYVYACPATASPQTITINPTTLATDL